MHIEPKDNQPLSMPNIFLSVISYEKTYQSFALTR